MSSLYFDTTNQIQLGLLNEEMNWVTYEIHPERKASEAIHGLIDEILRKNNIKFNELKNIFKLAGPGSYTGMRVGEGMAQVLEWQGHEVLGFYHYDIAKILYPQGLWFAKAFKNEIYFFEWNNEDHKTFILSLDKAKLYLKHYEKAIFSSDESRDFDVIITSTSKLIQDNPAEIFKTVIKNKWKKELFYFRPLNEEFNRKEKE